MKHIKTFESFSHVNEGTTENFVERLKVALKAKENDPRLKDLITKLKDQYKKLTEDDLKDLKKNDTKATEETMEKISESLISEGLGSKILKYIGLGGAVIGFLVTLFAIIKYIGIVAMVTSAGLSLGALVSVSIPLLIGGGLLAGVAHIAGSPELDEKPRSVPRRK